MEHGVRDRRLPGPGSGQPEARLAFSAGRVHTLPCLVRSFHFQTGESQWTDISDRTRPSSCTLGVLGRGGKRLGSHAVETNAKALIEVLRSPEPDAADDAGHRRTLRAEWRWVIRETLANVRYVQVMSIVVGVCSVAVALHRGCHEAIPARGVDLLRPLGNDWPPQPQNHILLERATGGTGGTGGYRLTA